MHLRNLISYIVFHLYDVIVRFAQNNDSKSKTFNGKNLGIHLRVRPLCLYLSSFFIFCNTKSVFIFFAFASLCVVSVRDDERVVSFFFVSVKQHSEKLIKPNTQNDCNRFCCVDSDKLNRNFIVLCSSCNESLWNYSYRGNWAPLFCVHQYLHFIRYKHPKLEQILWVTLLLLLFFLFCVCVCVFTVAATSFWK